MVKRDEELVEVQGTGEGGTFDRTQLSAMLDAADLGVAVIYRAQLDSLGIAR